MGWWKADPEPESNLPPYSEPSQTIPSSLQSPPAKSLPSECPIDPKTRSVWLQQAQKQKESARRLPAVSGTEASSCPVDTKARETWLQQAKSQGSQLPQGHPQIPRGRTPARIQDTQDRLRSTQPPGLSVNPVPSTQASKECSSDRISQAPSTEQPNATIKTARPLSHEREVSSIPRGQVGAAILDSARPSNSESETGHDKASGNWIYPSESQFFNAVMRKQTASDPHMLASSISSIIPIHNAVNERAWHLIKTWEGDTSKACGGPKLLSFQGLGAGALSPRAKMKTWMGYTEPFDRHDWIVERCGGQTVEYVIDFYQGKAPEGGNPRDAANLNFFLDVRPKLNSVEGCKMRLERFMGWR